MERVRKCIVCGKPIEGHALKYCKACRKEAYKERSRLRKRETYQERPKAGYLTLGIYILKQAIHDYPIQKYHKEVVSFLKSDRCYAITGVSGEKVLRILEREHAKKIKRVTPQEETHRKP